MPRAQEKKNFVSRKSCITVIHNIQSKQAEFIFQPPIQILSCSVAKIVLKHALGSMSHSLMLKNKQSLKKKVKIQLKSVK